MDNKITDRTKAALRRRFRCSPEADFKLVAGGRLLVFRTLDVPSMTWKTHRRKWRILKSGVIAAYAREIDTVFILEGSLRHQTKIP